MKKALAAIASLAVAAVASAETRDWRAEGDQAISDRKKAFENLITDEARNVILFIADGNGVNTNYGTRLYQGQLEGGYGDEFVLSHEKMLWTGLVKTYNTNAQTPDSAGTATAMNTGYKTKSGVIGFGEGVSYGDCSTIPGNELPLLAEQAYEMGKKVGVVSTARVTHATPAAVYARSADRDYEAFVPGSCTEQDDIALQLIDAMVGDNAFVDLAMGGGRTSFFNATEVDFEGEFGMRVDGRDLIAEAEAAGVKVAHTSDELYALTLEEGDKLLALFASSHVNYEHDRVTLNTTEPSIMEMTKVAIDLLSKNDDGYYLMVEAGRVDHANHAGNLHRTFVDGVAYQAAVQYAMDNTDPSETLIISTADHGHSITYHGYCGRGSNATGLCMQVDDAGEKHTGNPNIADDGNTFTVLAVGNGPGSILYTGGVNFANVSDEGIAVRPNATNEEAMDPEYLQQSLIPLESETHSGADVALYAQGPWAHLFVGCFEQTHIYDVMWYAMTHG